MNVSLNGLIPSDSSDIYSLQIAQFRALLADKKYEKAAQLATSVKEEFYFKEFKFDLIAHGNGSEFVDDLRVVIDVFTEVESCSMLDTDWMEALPSLFKAIIQSYLSSLNKKNCSSDEIQIKLKEVLAGFLTYPQLTLEQAKILIQETVDFDPILSWNPKFPTSPSFMDYASYGGNKAILTYFKSFLSEKPKQLDEEVDVNEFCGIAELKGTTFDLEPPKGEFMKLENVQNLYRLIGRNPILEGDTEFFKREVILRMENFSLDAQKALQSVHETYQSNILEYESIKNILSQHHFEIFCTRQLILDTAVSGGRESVGTISFKKGPAVYKRFASISPKYPGFSDIYRVLDFITRSRILKTKVPNIVEIFPHLILNLTKKGDIDVGYLMKVEPGEQLRKISQISADEKVAIQKQFDQSVDLMLQSGYVLYDFNDDNVLWDGKKLTFIDISEAGFKQEALRHADTDSVKWRMSEMLARKSK